MGRRLRCRRAGAGLSPGDADAFLDGYHGETTAGLLALATRYRGDSIALAFELALQTKAEQSSLSLAEQSVLAIAALEREVNNGGYGQFFLNSSRVFAPIIVDALFAIDCPSVARITSRAIASLRVPEPLSPAILEARMLAEDLSLRRALAACDERYDAADEPLTARLLAWIARQQADIVLGG